MNESQLGWIQYNRGAGSPEPLGGLSRARPARRYPPREAQRVGDIARRVFEQGQARSVLVGRIWECLGTYVGEDLLAYVAVRDARVGVLTLEVAEAALAYELRLRWEQTILDLLQRHMPGSGISRVRFTVSRPG